MFVTIYDDRKRMVFDNHHFYFVLHVGYDPKVCIAALTTSFSLAYPSEIHEDFDEDRFDSITRDYENTIPYNATSAGEATRKAQDIFSGHYLSLIRDLETEVIA
jgi:hypothetical protein